MVLIIDFSKQSLKLDAAEDCMKIVDEFDEKLESADGVDFSGNTLGVEAAKFLGPYFKNANNLKILAWNDLFTGRLKTEIAPALQHLSDGLMLSQCRLIRIDLSHNAFGPNGIIGVTDLLKSPQCKTLKELCLDNQGLGHKGFELLVESLMFAADDGQKLTLFSAGRNRLENFGAEKLAQLFQKYDTLEELNLPQNGIGIHGDSEFRLLLKAISMHKSLQKLDLSDNSLRPTGAANLAKFLRNWTNLKVLSLNDCLIKSSGCRHLLNAFSESESSCPILEHLNLVGNEIGSEVAILLVQKLLFDDERLSILKTIDLNGNALGWNGIEQLEILLATSRLEIPEISVFYGSGFCDDEGSCDENSYDEGENITNEEEDEEYNQDGEESQNSVHEDSNQSGEKLEYLKNFSFLSTFEKLQTSGINLGSKDVLFDNLNSTDPRNSINLFGSIKCEDNNNNSNNNENFSSLFELKPSLLTDSVKNRSAQFDFASCQAIFSKFLNESGADLAVQILSMIVPLSKILTEAEFKSFRDTLESRPQGVIVNQPDAVVQRICFLLSRYTDSAAEQELALVHVASKVLSRVFVLHPSLGPNSFLVELGLIKPEDKKYKPQCGNLKILLQVLRELIVESRQKYDFSAEVMIQLRTVLNHFGPTRIKPRLSPAILPFYETLF